MTDPTPEDEYDSIAYGVCPIKHTPAAKCVICDNISKEIRAAVEAERERCAKVAESCSLAGHHRTRIADAIRRGPE